MTLCLDLPNGLYIVGQWLYDWQTLVSGGLALLAALIAACLLNKQIRQADKLADDAQNRKFMAARCLLPVHLVEVDNYCERVIDKLKPMQQGGFVADGTALILSSEMQFPSQSITHMSIVLEFTTSNCLAKLIAKIIGDLQVLQSCISSIRATAVEIPNRLSDNLEPSEVEHHIIQAAKIIVMVSSLYGYARQENDDLPNQIEWESVYNRLRRLHLPAEMQKRMNAYLDYCKTIGAVFSSHS